MSKGNEDSVRLRGERLQIMLMPDELAALDTFRFEQRMPSRAAAVRELFRLGLASVGTPALVGKKSSDFGVLDLATNGSRRRLGGWPPSGPR